MGLLEEQMASIEGEKDSFFLELESRIKRLKAAGQIGPPNHMHFTVGGDVNFKIVMLYVLNKRGLNIHHEGKRIGNKFVGDCTHQAFEEVIVYTLNSLGTIVYDKYQNVSTAFWKQTYEVLNGQLKRDKEPG
jgi:hypothetical protein